MANLFDAATAEAMKTRLARLRPESPRQWGTMSAAQAVAHCSAALETAMGDQRPPRLLMGRIFGRLVKLLALGDDKPFRRNTPTDPSLVRTGDRELEQERQRLLALIDRFAAAGPGGCTRHPHSFFGPLEPQEWALLMSKHLDHHLRQSASRAAMTAALVPSSIQHSAHGAAGLVLGEGHALILLFRRSGWSALAGSRGQHRTWTPGVEWGSRFGVAGATRSEVDLQVHPECAPFRRGERI